MYLLAIDVSSVLALQRLSRERTLERELNVICGVAGDATVGENIDIKYLRAQLQDVSL